MRTPSRFMPKLAATRLPVYYWAMLLSLFGAIAYWLWRYPIGAGALLAAIVVASWFNARQTRKQTRSHLHRLASERTGEDIGTFAKSADFRSLDTWIIRAVYEQLQCFLSSDFRNFPIRWSDRLESDLRIDAIDLDDVIGPQIAERTARDFKLTECNPYFGKVETAGDLVLFFSSQPRTGEARLSVRFGEN